MKSNKLNEEALAFQRMHPKEYMRKFLNLNLRIDGRNIDQCRTIHLNQNTITTSEGSVILRIGKTMVVTAIKAEIAEPNWEYPDEGYLVPNVELGPLCSNKIKPGPPNDQSMIYSHIVNQLLNINSLFDKKQLVIEVGKAVWTLYIDTICLSDDGNVLDASIISTILALKNVQLPKLVLDEEQGVYTVVDKEFDSLTVNYNLFPLSFVKFDSGIILSDPNNFEQEMIRNYLLIIVNDDNDLIYTYKYGDKLINKQELRECLQLTKERVNYIKSIIYPNDVE
ncbi:hypothetical protein K502DRAFT_343233 [Neoconidiobolus thromboides FSU 785]|nr:hypothetical protein K502DRAFT_343233 [Neoconidiobolus thromboides FSU 785]